MLSEGTILYFTPYYFVDSSKAKPKYFIVLHLGDGTLMIANLPTSKDHVPGNISKKHGCIDLPAARFNCYYFKAKKEITDNNWAFPRDTYLYGEQIAIFDREKIENQYPTEGIDYEIMGILTNLEYQQIIDCIKNSPTVKRKIRRKLGADI